MASPGPERVDVLTRPSGSRSARWAVGVGAPACASEGPFRRDGATGPAGAAASGIVADGRVGAVLASWAPAGGQATSSALRGLPIGAAAAPLRIAAMSSSLGYWFMSR